MRNIIFQEVPLVEASFFQKLFKQLPVENSVIELNNLLAKHPILEISRRRVNEIEKRYQIKLEDEFKLNLEEFYAVYLNSCLEDGSLRDEDFDNLNHLRVILSLDENTAKQLHHKIGEIVYRRFFEKAVSNGRLIRREEDFLEKIENDLELPKHMVKKISDETKKTFLENYVQNIIRDLELSPNKEQEINNIAESLKTDLNFNKETTEKLQRLHLYWNLENLPLSTVSCDIEIQKSEQCYFKIYNVKWHELRAIRQKPLSYNANFKIFKQLYVNSGSFKTRKYDPNFIRYIDYGNLYLTNKRIIFTGNKKNINIRFEKIFKLTPQSDGLEIDKETGKIAVIQLPKLADEFCMILNRLINERSLN